MFNMLSLRCGKGRIVPIRNLLLKDVDQTTIVEDIEGERERHIMPPDVDSVMRHIIEANEESMDELRRQSME